MQEHLFPYNEAWKDAINWIITPYKQKILPNALGALQAIAMLADTILSDLCHGDKIAHLK